MAYPRLYGPPVVIAAILWMSSWGFAGANQSTALGTREVARGVWFVEAEPGAALCNNIIIEMQGYLIVVDANYPDGARKAMTECRRLSRKPVRYVFDTHHHRDHAYGNSLWTKAGATTLAYKGVNDEMDRYEPTRWKETSLHRQDVANLREQDVERARQTFEKSPFVLRDETREVQFHFLGWAHTRGDGWAWLPKERILCTGDAVVNGPRNKLLDANIRDWPEVIDKAIQFRPRIVMPGHGGMGGAEILEGQKQFLTDLYEAVHDVLRQGKKPDEHNVQLPARDKNWVPQSLSQDIQATAEEISQNKPHGDIPHVWQ